MGGMKTMTHSRAISRALPGLRVDHLWALFALTLVGAFIALVPTPPNDFWWHLKAGELVVTDGLPTTNRFAWTLPADAPYVYATWLGEALFYQLYHLGGLGAVALGRNLLGLAGFALVALEARRRSGSWRLAALAVLLAGVMSTNNLIIRTQNWSWVPVGLYALLLGAYAAGQVRARALLALPVIMALWVNLHGGFVVGLGLVGVYALGETLRRWWGVPGARDTRAVALLWGVLLLTLLATLANPLGFGIFTYVKDLLTDPPSQGLINEWQPPTPRSLAGWFFYASILLLILALAYQRRRPTLTDVLLVLVFLWQAWNGARYVMWFGMVVMPILAQTLAAPTAQRRLPRATAANLLVAGLLAALYLAVQPPFKASLPLPPEYRAMFVDLPGAPLTFSADTPVAATAWLRDNLPDDARLFNEMGYGSYLAWALYPQAQYFIDPRVELYPLELWQDYVAITEGHDYNVLLDKHGVTHLMIDTVLQDNLATALAADPAWARVYQDARTEIYQRSEGRQ